MPNIKRTIFRILPIAGGWKVTANRVIFNRYLRVRGYFKRDAIADARMAAQHNEPSQVIIHGRDGKIQREMTYGADPRRTKG